MANVNIACKICLFLFEHYRNKQVYLREEKIYIKLTRLMHYENAMHEMIQCQIKYGFNYLLCMF